MMESNANNFFEVKLLTDKSRMNEIINVRLMAWEKSGNAKHLNDNSFFKRLNNDKENDYQFIIEDREKIIAVARIQMMDDIENLPNEYREFQMPNERPFGDYERVATHPNYRGLGLVRQIDDFVLKFAKDKGMPFIIAEALPPRDETFMRLGYKKLGSVNVENPESQEHYFTAVAFYYQFD